MGPMTDNMTLVLNADGGLGESLKVILRFDGWWFGRKFENFESHPNQGQEKTSEAQSLSW